MKNKKNIIFYLLIIASLILLILNINKLDFNDLSNGKYSGIISNILLIFANIVFIQQNRKKDIMN